MKGGSERLRGLGRGVEGVRPRSALVFTLATSAIRPRVYYTINGKDIASSVRSMIIEDKQD